MGIPSYYRRLVDAVGGLVKPVGVGSSTDYLWIDFNCIVYHCLRRPGAPVWAGESGRCEYEAALRAEVIKYVQYLVSSAGVRRGVGLAVDGVVPAAKRRQQRLRRAEPKEGGDGWDTNAITPGTAFMKDLMADLKGWQQQCKRERPDMMWEISTCDQPGEGEHKIMSWLRGLGGTGQAEHMVYGLDADLILLTLLTGTLYLPRHSFSLYREDQVDGAAAIGADGKEKMVQFSIAALYNFIVSKMPAVASAEPTSWIKDYVFAMSLLGNDFVPCMASLSLKEEGHTMLLDMLITVWKKGFRLVGVGNYSQRGWQALLDEVATGERDRIVKSAVRKRGMQAKEGMDPVEWFVEEAIFNIVEKPQRGGNTKEFLEIRADWQEIMLTRFSGLRGTTAAIREHITKEYMRGLEWIYYYYMHGLTPLFDITNDEGDRGLVLDFDWYYPSWIAPFAVDLWKGFDMQVPSIFAKGGEPCTPEEQLALVLPTRSWGLLAGTKEAAFAKAGDEWFGKATAHASFGKRWKWECHLNMPSPLLRDLRRTISSEAI